MKWITLAFFLFIQNLNANITFVVIEDITNIVWEDRVKSARSEGFQSTNKQLDRLQMVRLENLDPIFFSARVDIAESLKNGVIVHEMMLMLASGVSHDGSKTQCLVVLGRHPYVRKPKWEFAWSPTISIAGGKKYDTWKHVALPLDISHIKGVLEFHDLLPRASDNIGRRSTSVLAVFATHWKLLTGQDATQQNLDPLLVEEK